VGKALFDIGMSFTLVDNTLSKGSALYLRWYHSTAKIPFISRAFQALPGHAHGNALRRVLNEMGEGERGDQNGLKGGFLTRRRS
jgi:hypothetical protein